MNKLLKDFKLSYKAYNALILLFCFLFIVFLWLLFYYSLNDDKGRANSMEWGCAISGVICLFGSLFSITLFGSKALIAPAFFLSGVVVLYILIALFRWAPQNDFVLLIPLSGLTILVYFLANKT